MSSKSGPLGSAVVSSNSRSKSSAVNTLMPTVSPTPYPPGGSSLADQDLVGAVGIQQATGDEQRLEMTGRPLVAGERIEPVRRVDDATDREHAVHRCATSGSDAIRSSSGPGLERPHLGRG